MMKLLLFLVLFSLSLFVQAQDEDLNGDLNELGTTFDVDPRIVKGHRAERGEFPHNVYLELNGRYQCEGCLISKRSVLVAAHCVNTTNIQNLTVIVGATKIQKSRGIRMNIQKIDFASDDGHVAVIQLKQAVKYSRYVKPINLPSPAANYPQNTVLDASGYGLPHNSQIQTTIYLQKLSFKIFDRNRCQLQWFRQNVNFAANPAVICVKGDLSGLCFGDSGASFIYKDNSSDPILIGVSIASYDHDCYADVADIAANVSYYVPWITSVMTL